ncbi:MAG: hypothetical protein LQ350_002596 [Teloschistes chrysophthalmus]|nr:MAG: hypothetical protein LQ350_002596 [Niorma chrysophthalma]
MPGLPGTNGYLAISALTKKHAKHKVKTPKLLRPRIDPAQLKGRKEYPDPEPGPYQPWQSRVRHWDLAEDVKLPTSARVDLQKEFWDVGIQAVIQVTSIDLHFEMPEYPGESWHVQGQLNERICATVVYCYSCENISEASLSFRHRCSTDAHQWLNTVTRTTKETEDVYGVEDSTWAVQELGSVMIREGRVFQTKLNPFKLRDPAKPGHLKMILVHLIDPNRRIMSTSLVPCQRRDWWARDIHQIVPVLRRLPVEVFDNIIDMVDDFPISTTDAEKIRAEMLGERKEL